MSPDTSAILQYQQHFKRPAHDIIADLESYAALLRKWQVAQNLVSRETLPSLWTRHFADSLQALHWLRDDDCLILDIGSGGGFPALPLAIASKGSHRSFCLIEPNQRKASFLRTIARELQLKVDVKSIRIEQVDSRETKPVNVFTSRALAPLTQLCSWMAPLFGSQSRAVLHKGREHVEELKEAATHWDFDVLIHPSDTDPGGVLLILSNLRKKSGA